MTCSDDDGRGARKDERGPADVGVEKTNDEETEDGQTFSEWRVHPRVTPRKDIALQVKSGLHNVSL